MDSLFKTITEELRQAPFMDIRLKILSFILSIGVFTSFLSSAINIYNARPLSNITLPATLGLFCFALLAFLRYSSLRYPVKLTFMVLLSLVYVPVAWITSPGSTSAMPYYTLLILATVVLLIERPVEIVIPIGNVLIVIALLQYEALYPERFMPYTDRFYHSFDLSINFLAVSVILISLLFIVNRYFAKEHKLLYQVSITDPLTSIHNRRAVLERLSEIHQSSKSLMRPYTLVMFDINHFKRINDTYGHLAGDEVLSGFAAILKTHLRRYDIVGRYGGDEFMLILPNTFPEDVPAIITDIRDEFEKLVTPYRSLEISLGVGITAGITGDFEAVIHQADLLMYENKKRVKAKDEAAVSH